MGISKVSFVRKGATERDGREVLVSIYHNQKIILQIIRLISVAVIGTFKSY